LGPFEKAERRGPQSGRIYLEIGCDFVLELKDQTPFAALRSPCCRLLQHGKHSAINDLKNYYSM
jgi:hypothetical protein